MKIRYRLEAQLDIARIHIYLDERSVRAASAAIGRIREAINYLANFPHIGHVGHVRNAHEWPVKGLPYVIVYRVNASREEIEILAIFHGAQDR